MFRLGLEKTNERRRKYMKDVRKFHSAGIPDLLPWMWAFLGGTTSYTIKQTHFQ